MALHSEAIESRLESLKLDNRRIRFDSKLQAFRRDSKATTLSDSQPTKQQAKRPEADSSIENMITLLEALSQRIDGLERKDRALVEEMRLRARRDQIRRRLVAGFGMAFGAVLFACWLKSWL